MPLTPILCRLGLPIAALFAMLTPAAEAAMIVGEPIRREFDGRSDDLLTAGLDAVGLAGAPPGFADEAAPSPLELRRRAIYNAWRGLIDTTPAGGFGRLHGPAQGQRIAGVEILAAVRAPGGQGISTVMLQLPGDFDAARPCVVVAAASGSRGIYGALPTAAEWALRHRCAVVTTDKGNGVGFFDLDSGTGVRIDGTLTTDPADPLLTFRPTTSAALREWQASHPHRIAVRHAHGGDNPESDWGRYVLQAAEVGFELLNRELVQRGGSKLRRRSTTILGAGISNGGGAVLRALEQDRHGWFDGAVVSEPNVQPLPTPDVTIRMGERPPLPVEARSIYDYTMLQYVYEPGAVLAPPHPASPLALMLPMLRPQAEAWLTRLAADGLVSGDTVEARALDARRRLEAAGLLPEALELSPINVQFALWPAIAATYTSAYGRLPVESPPCGVGFAAVDGAGVVRAHQRAELARWFADGSGIAPTASVQIVAGDDPGRFASLGSYEDARCFRDLAEGRGADPAMQALATTIQRSIGELRATAKLRQKPVLMLHGRADSLIAVNHTARAYYARHRSLGELSLRYYEVEHGQHFDGFLVLPGLAQRFVPIQPHLNAALALLRDHLQNDTPLPPSQVIRTRPRAPDEPELTAEHLGRIRPLPGADAITFDAKTLRVPE